jgi:hypothetical protein
MAKSGTEELESSSMTISAYLLLLLGLSILLILDGILSFP